ncbi:protein translocase subunit SecF [Patescibacteria group bacterium]|nr:protein translocase subunit SecF [Patescibacteria group bacterium]MCL5010110.1 protein translocase subunit SecF [Patescibacteria group bacterium]
MDIIGKKYLYFAISLTVIIPGLLSLIFFGLNLSIDFAGGSRITLLFPQNVNQKMVDQAKNIIEGQKLKTVSIEPLVKEMIIRTSVIDTSQNSLLMDALRSRLGKFKEEDYETIGPIIGSETTKNALTAVLIASVFIVVYIAWAFREIPKPASSFRFGICAIAALLHDVLVVTGIFSILGHFFAVEVDSLFFTAILTVIGFSVHDTIVVFDRIRENLKRMGAGRPFSAIVNDSILQTLDRSLNTSLTVLLVLFALLLFGGESTKWFVTALIIGVVSGTYSSIFNASPLLVVWQEFVDRKNKD